MYDSNFLLLGKPMLYWGRDRLIRNITHNGRIVQSQSWIGRSVNAVFNGTGNGHLHFERVVSKDIYSISFRFMCECIWISC